MKSFAIQPKSHQACSALRVGKARNVNVHELRARGFTLIELMVTLAILAILASIAVPSMRSFLGNSKLEDQGRKVLDCLSGARAAAATSQRPVTATIAKYKAAANPNPADFPEVCNILLSNDGSATITGTPSIVVFDRSYGVFDLTTETKITNTINYSVRKDVDGNGSYESNESKTIALNPNGSVRYS